ncbi:MAG: dihydropteroate synthase [Candidatus Cloacimonetes bacterium]|nr:dihydropteroate synthase [Candidatus Cloacimonadota bacterium]
MNYIIDIKDKKQTKAELLKIGVSSQGIEAMALKAINSIIKLEDVNTGAANILKQEMLALGGDAALASGIVEGKKEKTDVLLLGNADKIYKLITKLNNYSIFGLQQIQFELKRLSEQLDTSIPKKLTMTNSELTLDSTKIIGILNITPDSFSDGGNFETIENAVAHALKMKNDGAELIDIGGESTRPGAENVSSDEEIKRICPIINEIKSSIGIPVSVDTYKASTARKAVEAGADIINDISALRFDKKMIELLVEHENIPIILMHMLGNPKNMQINPTYIDVIKEILQFFSERIETCLKKGIKENRIIIDPGIGFGKRHEDNLKILNNLEAFRSLGFPVVLGASRKSFIGKIYPSSVSDRLAGTLATSALAFEKKIDFIRVHDVKENCRLLKTLMAIKEII